MSNGRFKKKALPRHLNFVVPYKSKDYVINKDKRRQDELKDIVSKTMQVVSEQLRRLEDIKS